MTYPAISIANYFIEKAQEDNVTDLTLMKLIKLVYIAHGTYLAVKEKNLIKEKIQAWKFGPVIKSLYKEFGYYGMAPITETASHIVESGEGQVSFRECNIPEDDVNTLSILNQVWDHFKKYSGVQLSNWTHLAGSPWYKAWHHEGGSEKFNHIISNDLIKNYFKDVVIDDSQR